MQRNVKQTNKENRIRLEAREFEEKKRRRERHLKKKQERREKKNNPKNFEHLEGILDKFLQDENDQTEHDRKGNDHGRTIMQVDLNETSASQWLEKEGFTSTQTNFQWQNLCDKMTNKPSFFERILKIENPKTIPKISTTDFYGRKSTTAYAMIQTVSLICIND